jgi:hypothetical protein
LVIPVGFVLHPLYDFSGATPDGLVGNDGILEIKSPKPETLLEWLETGQVPDEYQKQCQWEMACCDRQWADFYGWYPRMPHFFKRLDRDDVLIAQMEAEVEKLHLEIESFLAQQGFPPTVWNDFERGGLGGVPPCDEYDESKSFVANCEFMDAVEIVP